MDRIEMIDITKKDLKQYIESLKKIKDETLQRTKGRTGRPILAPMQRFWSKIDVRKDHECWNWRGGRTGEGYGKFDIGKRQLLAHRLAWMLHSGREIPEGMYICHYCHNRACCNPMHLYCGTHEDNMQDMVESGRAYQRSKFGAKLIAFIRGLKIRGFCKEHAACLSETSSATVWRIWKSERYLSNEGLWA